MLLFYFFIIIVFSYNDHLQGTILSLLQKTSDFTKEITYKKEYTGERKGEGRTILQLLFERFNHLIDKMNKLDIQKIARSLKIEH